MTFYDMTWLERLLFLKRIKGGSGHEETTTSNTFVTDMVAPLRKLLLSFAPKQSGSGDPSPTNVRPISGWDGVSVVRSGKNLLNPNASRSKGNFVSEGVIAAAGNTYVFGVRCVPNQSYTIYTKDAGVQFRVGLTKEYPAQGVAVDYLATRGNNDNPYTFNTSDNSYIALATSSSAESCANTMVIIGSETETSYEPYAGQTYTTALGQTVYGGTLDMVSGVLTVTQKLVDLGSLAWSVRNEYFRTAVQSDAKKGVNGVLSNAHCSALVVSTPNGFLNTNNSITVATDGRFNAYSTAWTGWTGAQVQEALDGVMFTYELATPTTYQLTPQQINTLIGTNVITTDANVEEIIYLKKAE